MMNDLQISKISTFSLCPEMTSAHIYEQTGIEQSSTNVDKRMSSTLHTANGQQCEISSYVSKRVYIL